MTDAPSTLVLALETSGRQGGVAVLRDGRVLATGEIPSASRTAAAMTPLIAETLQQSDVALSQINLVAVIDGPGSFTGLRVGVTTAKTLAYTLGCDVIGINTLRVIAQQAPADASPLWAVIDAQRQQLFAARFERDETGQIIEIQDTTIVDNDAWLNQLAPGDHVTGPGLNRLRDRLPPHVHGVDMALWHPRAETVGALGDELYKAGQRNDFWKLVPQYFRQSAAEEKAAGRNI